MAELLKNQYNYKSIHKLALSIQEVYPSFKVEDFISDVMDETWDKLEIKARMRQIAINLGKYLPTDYQEALSIIDQVVARYPAEFNDYTLMYFPDFVEVFGQNERHWDLSMAALERYTQSSTAEFAVRPFIIKHEKKMMQQMTVWSRHENQHVRRLASEGSRPRLPWGQALVSFKKDPTLVIPILEQLKTDDSLYVRKSVANNLNDISKSHPDLVIKIANDWYGKNKNTDWILKHGCRTLLKKGNREILSIFGFENNSGLTVKDFTLGSHSVMAGEAIIFSFKIATKATVKIRLEYSIGYVKANGKQSHKVFQISETILKENSEKTYTKKHSFADIRSRKHYFGTHSITLIVNGIKQNTLDFELLPPA